jgi:hypothetical protein
LNPATAASDAFSGQPAGASFTTGASLADQIVVFEMMPEACMDVGNGYKTLSVATSASNAANVTEVTLFLLNAVQAQPPTAPTTYA